MSMAEAEPAIDALAELSSSDVNRGLVVDDDRLAGFLPWAQLDRRSSIA
jgi:hypothetical protein